MASFKRFADYITEHVNDIAAEVVENVIQSMELNIPKWEKDQAISMYKELLIFLGESIASSGDEDIAPECLLAWSKKNSEMQVSNGRDITEIVVRYPPTRVVFTDLFTKISMKLDLSLEENAQVIKRINSLLDVSLNETVFSYQCLSEQYKEEKEQELLELSAPIVPVKNDTIIIPLNGYIDTKKIDHIMDRVIPKIADLKVKHVITDFSGVITIDEHIAESFHRIGKAMKIMGIHVIMTGLRPDFVRTLVNSDIDISAIETFATVKQALDRI